MKTMDDGSITQHILRFYEIKRKLSIVSTRLRSKRCERADSLYCRIICGALDDVLLFSYHSNVSIKIVIGSIDNQKLNVLRTYTAKSINVIDGTFLTFMVG